MELNIAKIKDYVYIGAMADCGNKANSKPIWRRRLSAVPREKDILNDNLLQFHNPMVYNVDIEAYRF